jgi:hypothetical protein
MVIPRIGLWYRYAPLLLVGLLWSAGDVAAATTFSEYANVTEDTVWTLAESPYVILDNTRLQFEVADLVIEPGVVVKFGRGSQIEVFGSLLAEGTADEPIIFTSLRNDAVLGDTNGDGSATVPRATDDWGISVTGDPDVLAEVRLDHVEFSYSRRGLYGGEVTFTMRDSRVATSTQGVGLTGGEAHIDTFRAEGVTQDSLILFYTPAMITNITVRHGQGYGLETFFSDVTIEGVICENLASQCIYTYQGEVTVRDVWVKSTQPLMNDVALSFFDSPLTLETVVVENIGNRAGLAIYNTTATVKDVILSGGSDYGFELIGFSLPTKATIENMTVTGFEIGMYLSNVDLDMVDTKVVGNGTGIETDMANAGDVITIRQSTIADNAQFGVYDYSDPGFVDMRENWWGDASGPLHAVGNPGGLGNRVAGNVLYGDWLLLPPGVLEEPEIDPLLLQYMPVLYMHPEEDYFPMNVEAFVEGSAIWDDRDLLPDELIVSAGPGNAASLAYIATTTDTSDWYIQFSGIEAKEFDLVAAKARYQQLVEDGSATTTVYVHKMEDSYVDDAGIEHEFIVLQYWYFYAMNNWAEQGGFNNHEGDWESVFIFLDKETEEPVYAAFSAHHNDGEPSNPLQYGSVRRIWNNNEIRFDTNRLISFVSLGSHANYVDIGNGGFHMVPGLFGNNEDEVSSSGKVSRTFETLELSTNLEWFFNYKGKWGADSISFIGSDGPQGPYFNNVSGILRFHEPIKWAGIDSVSEQVVATETDTLSFGAAEVFMKFKALLKTGTTVSAALYREVISFGGNLGQVNFLPRYWEFETSLPNNTFEVEVTIPYDKASLQTFGVAEEWLTAYYFNESTNAWEAVPSFVNSAGGKVTFTTSHFSRYALGSPVLAPVATSTLNVGVRPGRFNQAHDTRDYMLTLTNVGTTTLTGILRMVVEGVSLQGAALLDASGADAFGQAYVDINLPQSLLVGQQLTMPIRFQLPTEMKASARANSKAQNENAIKKKIDFKVKILRYI